MFNLHESVFGLRKNFRNIQYFFSNSIKIPAKYCFKPLIYTLTKIKNQTFLNRTEN